MLEPKEIYTNISNSHDTAKDLTRTLDYYTAESITTSSYSGATKKNGTSTDYWWLRSAYDYGSGYFYFIDFSGEYYYSNSNSTFCVSLAFRVG